MSHFSKKTILALDIGTNFVKALIASETEDGGLEILGTGRVGQESGAMRAGVILDTDTVTETCDKAISEAEEKADVAARKVVIGATGEIVKSFVSRVHYRRSDGGRIFTDEELEAIITKIENANKEKAKSEIAFVADDSDVEVELLDSMLVSFSIDGKTVDDPVGCEGEDVVIEYYTSFALSTYVRTLEEICSKLKLELLAVSVNPFAISRAILGNEDKKETAVILDIGSEDTNITILDEGNLRGTESFNIGTKSLAKDLDIWLSGLNIALSNLPHVPILPSKVILCGGGAESFELQEFLALGNWYEDLAFDRRPMVQTLEKTDLPGLEGEFELSFAVSVGLARIGFESED